MKTIKRGHRRGPAVVVATTLVLGIGAWLSRAEGSAAAEGRAPTDRLRSAPKKRNAVARPDWTVATDRGTGDEVSVPREVAPSATPNGAVERRTGGQLGEQVLMSRDDLDELHDRLSDTSAIERATGLLLNDRPTDLNPEDQQQRMEAVQLLSDALRWQDNPSRSDVLSACKRVILSDNYHQIRDGDARRSVAADRLELFLALDATMPEEAAKLAKDSEGSPNAKLLAHAARIAHAGRTETNHAESQTK